MQNHEAQGHRDQGEVSPTDPFDDGMGGAGGGLHVDGPDDEVVARSGVTISASLRQVRGIDGGARVGGGKDVMHSMAGSAVGNTLRSAARGEAVVTVGVRWDAIGGQIIAQRQAFIAVTSSARGHGDARRADQRSLLFRAEDQVLAVAVAAHGRGGHAGSHGLPVHAFEIGRADVFVALPAGCGNIPMIDFGTRILRRKDAVAAVTIGASGGSLVSARHRAPMDTLAVKFDRMGEGNFVAREKLLVAVTGGASIRQIFLGDARGAIARHLDLMHIAMA